MSKIIKCVHERNVQDYLAVVKKIYLQYKPNSLKQSDSEYKKVGKWKDDAKFKG